MGRDFRNGKRAARKIVGDNARIIARRPADAAFDEILKTRMAPRAVVVPPGSIKHPALAVSLDPGPRLFALVIHAVFQHGAARFVVQVMLVGLVPTLKAAEALHDGMLRRGQFRAECPRAMLQELRPHERDHILGIAKAKARTVEWHKTLAARDIFQQCLFFRRGNRIDVRIQQKRIILFQVLGIEIPHLIGIDQFNAPLFENGFKLHEAFPRLVVAVVAQEQDLQILRLGTGNERCNEQARPSKFACGTWQFPRTDRQGINKG